MYLVVFKLCKHSYRFNETISMKYKQKSYILLCLSAMFFWLKCHLEG